MTKTSLATRVGISLLFIGFYAAFLVETTVLFQEYHAYGLAMRLATLDAQNFIFFPIAGLLALVGFWRPTVFVTDALAAGRIRAGRLVLVFSMVATALVSWVFYEAFSASENRSMFEVAPSALLADRVPAGQTDTPARQPLVDALISMKILSKGPEGLSPYKARCDTEWLRFSPAAGEEKLCLPAGREMSVADCCTVKTAFRERINELSAEAPSLTATVHRYILPVKIFFLVHLFAVGVLLVRFRPRLKAIYGERLEDVSFGIAVGGLVMLTWPLLNAAYLETIALLTGDGTSNAYTVMAPLIAFGFGIWALLLIFFHLRSYPSQVEYAARIGGFLAAAVGVLRYEEITGFLIAHLGIGGGVVAIVIFAAAVAALAFAVIFGLKPQDFDLDDRKPREP